MKRLLAPGSWQRGTGILALGTMALVMVLTLQVACARRPSTHTLVAPDGTAVEITPQDVADLAARKRQP